MPFPEDIIQMRERRIDSVGCSPERGRTITSRQMFGDKASSGLPVDALQPYPLRSEPTGKVPDTAQIGVSCRRCVASLDQGDVPLCVEIRGTVAAG